MAVVPTQPLSSDRTERENQVLSCLRPRVGTICFFNYEGRETHDRLTGRVIAIDGVPDAPPNNAYEILGLDREAKIVRVRNIETEVEIIVPFYKVREVSQIIP